MHVIIWKMFRLLCPPIEHAGSIWMRDTSPHLKPSKRTFWLTKSSIIRQGHAHRPQRSLSNQLYVRGLHGVTYNLHPRGVTSHCSTRTWPSGFGLLVIFGQPITTCMRQGGLANVHRGNKSSSAVMLSHLECSLSTSDARLLSRAFSAAVPPQTILQASAPSEQRGKLHHHVTKGARSLACIPWLSGFAEVAWRFPSLQAGALFA